MVSRSSPRRGDGDIVVALHSGNGPTPQPLNALQTSMWGKDAQGRHQRGMNRDRFFINHHSLDNRDYLATGPMVDGFVPAAPATVVQQHDFDHGATAITMKVDSWHTIETTNNGKKRLIPAQSSHPQIVQRSLLVDFPEDDEVSAVIIVADTFSGFASSTKKWQQWHGNNTAHKAMSQDINRATIRLFTGADRVTIRDKFVMPKKRWESYNLKEFYYLQGQAFSDKSVGVRLFQEDEGQRRGSLRFEYDEQTGVDQPGGSFNDLSGLEGLGFGDDDLLALEQAGNEPADQVAQIITVWTLQNDKPPRCSQVATDKGTKNICW